jgi:hypothetical protein
MNVTFPHLLQIVNSYDSIFAEMETQKTSYPKDKIRILFLENISDAAVKNFRGNEYSNVEKITKALTEDDLVKEIKDVHILGIRSKTQISCNKKWRCSI